MDAMEKSVEFVAGSVEKNPENPEYLTMNDTDVSEPPAKKAKEDFYDAAHPLGDGQPNDTSLPYNRGPPQMLVSYPPIPMRKLNEGPSFAVAKPANPESKLTEIDVGITEYVGKHFSGFSAVIKQRYSDFLVNEIDMRGNVVTLSDVTAPPDDTKRDDTLEVLGQETIDRLKLFAAGSDTVDEPFTIDVENLGKVERRSIHESVRTLFPTLETGTEEFAGRKFILVERSRSGREASSSFQRGRRQTWPHGRGNYTYFVLHKENVDTLEAVNLVSRFLKIKAGVFTYAGVKDKRAKTAQLVSVYRTEASKILGLNGTLRNMVLGNIRYAEDPLQLGDLTGNRFRIVLRNATGSPEDIDTAMTSLMERGFINYYGMQRFGTTSVPTHRVGMALIRSHWNNAIELIMRPRAGEDANMTECRRLWFKTRDPKRVLQRMRRQSSVEAFLLRGLDKHSWRDPVGALSMIPRNMRLMYVHSYQSHVWNRVVSRRIREHGMNVLVGDLLLSRDSVREVVGEDEAEVLPMEDPPKPRIRHPKPVPVKIKTEEEAAAASIHEVVFPLPGYDVAYPNNEVRGWYKEFLEKDGVTMQNFHNKVKDYSLPGSYRHAFIRPTNVTWDIVRYDNPEVALLLSDKDVMDGVSLPETEANTGARQAVRLQFDLRPSCYATMALREILRADTSAAFQATLNVPADNAAALQATLNVPADNADALQATLNVPADNAAAFQATLNVPADSAAAFQATHDVLADNAAAMSSETI